MSAALVEPIIQSPKTPTLVPPLTPSEQKETAADRHPMLPVLIAGFIALNGALLFVGWILMWLAFRHTGINAHW